MAIRDFILLIGLLVIEGVLCTNNSCPHERTLKRWSANATWGTNGKPILGSRVVIDEGILLDESPPDLKLIYIAETGSLVFDPTVDILLRVANIHVYGTFEIGSHECAHTGRLRIVLTGNRESHVGETEAKGIIIRSGGSIDIHGEPKQSWSKLTQTLEKDSKRDMYFEHKRRQQHVDYRSTTPGLVMYTFTTNPPWIKRLGVFDLHNHYADAIEQIDGVEDGDVLMVASQMYVRQPEGSDRVPQVYDALERLIYGKVTNNSILRTVDGAGETYAMVYQKGNNQSLDEIKNPLGTSSSAQLHSGGYVFVAEVNGNDQASRQQDNFRIGTYDQMYPKLHLTDDVSTWLPGDKLVIASTDYDWRQAEEVEVAFCEPGDCGSQEVRIDGHIKYDHFGEIVAGAVDMRGEVGVLTRSIVIESETEDECPSYNGNCGFSEVRGLDTFGGHIQIMRGYANARIEYAELRNLGQQTDLGRYPIHFHLCLDKLETAEQPYVRGNSIHDSFSRCVTIHGSHGVLVENNLCYNQMGHGYFLEDGGELDNVFDGNLAISTRKGTGTLEPTDQGNPAAFWMTNPRVFFRNNVAAGGEGFGIWFIFPTEPLPPSRQFNITQPDEAKRTMIPQFYNNVAHSQVRGIMIGNRLDDERNNHCCNKWQPRADPTDSQSAPLQIPLSKITCYKNKDTNLWIEGGLLNVSHVSTADSLNGMLITNEGLQNDFAGRISYAVVIGESANIGEPWPGFNRSLPIPHNVKRVQSGVTVWKGPMKYSHIWFDGFQSNPHYDIAAIAKKRNSPYFFSVLTSFTDAQFAFNDGVGQGNIAISGTNDLPGWEGNTDGELTAGFTLIKDDGTKEYVVKPDPFSSAGADCKLRPNWRLARCSTKYANIRMYGDFTNRHVVWVRDSYPGAQLEFEMRARTGPQVVMDGSETYTVHFPQSINEVIRLFAEGLEQGDTLRVGVCTPIGAEVVFSTSHPYSRSMSGRNALTRVDTLEDLDAQDDLDGKKYFFDETTGMVYYKFINTETRNPDEWNTCNNNRCPDFKVRVLSGNYNDADCRTRLYSSAELALLPAPLELDDEVIPANGGSMAPAGYGAGPTKPFLTLGGPVDGGFSKWSNWSVCSKTCGVGEHFRTRQCNNPLPANGGSSCKGEKMEVEDCQIVDCATDGGFSNWSDWSSCTGLQPDNPDICSGKSERSRDCDSPPPQYNGEYCTGATLEVQPCRVC